MSSGRAGWRLVPGEFRTQVLTGSLPLAADAAGGPRRCPVPAQVHEDNSPERSGRVPRLRSGRTGQIGEVYVEVTRLFAG